jgi:hypothetical protein
MSNKFKYARAPLGNDAGPLLDAQAPALRPPSIVVEDLPEVHSLGLSKVKGGWVLLVIKSQGTTIVDSEVVSGPGPLSVAMESFKITAIKNFFPSLTGR